MPPLSFSHDYPKLLLPNDVLPDCTSEVKMIIETDEIELISRLTYKSPSQHAGKSTTACIAQETSFEVSPTRRVSFDSRKMYRKIPTRKSFTTEESANVWMTLTDYERTRIDSIETYRLLDMGALIDTTDTKRCSMGIESTVRYRQHRKNYRAALGAVLSEQSTQRSDGFRCEDLIAMSYMEYTENAQNRAYLTGVMMAVQAK